MEKQQELTTPYHKGSRLIPEDNCGSIIPQSAQQIITARFCINNLKRINDCYVSISGCRACNSATASVIETDCTVVLQYTDCCGCRKTAEKEARATFSNLPLSVCGNAFAFQVENPPYVNIMNNTVSVINTVNLSF